MNLKKTRTIKNTTISIVDAIHKIEAIHLRKGYLCINIDSFETSSSPNQFDKQEIQVEYSELPTALKLSLKNLRQEVRAYLKTREEFLDAEEVEEVE